MTRQPVVNAVNEVCAASLARYPEYARLAALIPSSNLQDDECSQLAMAAFSSYAPLECWGYLEFDAFCTIRAEDLTAEVLDWHSPHSAQYERCACLCIGGILGLAAIATLREEDDFTIARATLAAFMSSRLAQIDALEIHHMRPPGGA